MSSEELLEAMAARIPFTTSFLFHGPSEWPDRDERLRIAGLLQPAVHAYASRQSAEELGEALSIAATRSPLEAVAWMARRHLALITREEGS